MAKDLHRGRDWNQGTASRAELSLEFESFTIPLILGDDMKRLTFLARLFEFDEGPEGDVCYTPHQLKFLKRDVEEFLQVLDTKPEDSIELVSGHSVTIREVRRWTRRLLEVVEAASENEEFLFAFAD